MDDLDELKAIRELIDQCTRIASLITVDQATKLVNANNYVDTLMPFMDPTEYRNQMDNIRIRDIQFRAFLDFRTELERIKTYV